MKNVEIYTLDYCPYCHEAKALLDRKDIKYRELDITNNEEELREKLKEFYNIQGSVTLPQIIIGGKRIGGCDSLKALDASGELDKLLQEE